MSDCSFNFDHLPNRKGSGAIKWDRFPDYTPFWVADMDFPSPPCIQKILHERVEHGIFGYANAHPSLIQSILDYLKRSFHFEAQAQHLHHLPGMVPALSIACRAFATKGESVMINSPVYYPFFKVAKDAAAELIDVPHCLDDTRWTFDWPAMEAAVRPDTKVLLLSNPQNPLGRVFSESEICQLAEFCERHDLVLVSDEIHCDLILDPTLKHFSALNLPEKLRQRCITLLAPSKTYNIAGLGYSFAVIENAELRQKFTQAIGCTLPEINALALYAAEAAYRDGELWRLALLNYLRENERAARQFILQEIPEISIPHPQEATYLLWLDCRNLQLPDPCQFLMKHAKLLLTDGTPFGRDQHLRLNFGCPRPHLLEALHAMRDAFQAR